MKDDTSTNNQQNSQSDQQKPKVYNPLAAMQPGEQVICEIKRHPIGLIGTYVMAGIVLFIGLMAAFVFVPAYVPEEYRSQAMTWSIIGLLFLAFFVLVFTYISAYVYKGSRWIVTDDSITQISQVGLFSKQSSQLSLHNLEDITVDQHGIVQSMFNYGTLKAETAGEHSKFTFPFCPSPNDCAREILLAREKFMGAGSFEGKASGVNLNTNS